MNAPSILIPAAHSIEAEHCLLGGLMLDNAAWDKISGLLKAEDFYRDDHRRIFSHIQKLITHGAAADVVTVFASIEMSNEVDQTGGLGYLGEIANNTPSAANILHYAGVVCERAKTRTLQVVAADLATIALSDPAAAIATAERALAEMVDKARDLPTPLTWADSINPPAPAEFVLSPLQPGDVGIISGGDGIGKSWVAMTLAASVAAGVGLAGLCVDPLQGSVLYLAGEDRRDDHRRRLCVLGEYVRREYPGVDSRVAENLTIRPLQGRRMPLFQGEQSAGYAATREGRAFKSLTKGHRLVILDPLRMFHDLQENDGAGMDNFVRWLVMVAMENQQVIVVVHHVSQSAMLDGREDHHAGRGATDFPAGCRGAWVLRGMSPSEAKAAGISEEDRGDWRCWVNPKATHTREGGRVWLQRRPGGLLVRSSYTHAEMVDAMGAKGKDKSKGRGYDDF
jgi:RecA-family ATPase